MYGRLFFSSFRLEFESQCARLNAQREYEENQLEQEKKKLRKIEESIEEVERMTVEQREVIISGTLLSSEWLMQFCIEPNIKALTVSKKYIKLSTISFCLQEETKLLDGVEEGQKKLLEMKNQLLSKKSQVAAAKAELGKETQTLQEINK